MQLKPNETRFLTFSCYVLQNTTKMCIRFFACGNGEEKMILRFLLLGFIKGGPDFTTPCSFVQALVFRVSL